MGIGRIVRVLVLLWIALDLASPAMPGVFSLDHEVLFLDGVTRTASAAHLPQPPRGHDRAHDHGLVRRDAALVTLHPAPAASRPTRWAAPGIARPRLLAVRAPAAETEDH